MKARVCLAISVGEVLYARFDDAPVRRRFGCQNVYSFLLKVPYLLGIVTNISYYRLTAFTIPMPVWNGAFTQKPYQIVIAIFPVSPSTR